MGRNPVLLSGAIPEKPLNSSNKTAFVVGRIQGLSDFLKVEFDDTSEDKKDDYDH